MIVRKEFYLPSTDGLSKLHVVSWIPEGAIKAVLQLSHGMIEHILRYDEFADFMAEHSIAVVGHDHLGHGKTSLDENHFGFFSENKGEVFVLKDLYKVTSYIKHRFPGLPCFLLGHSMGSFFLRRYLTIYGRKVDGAIMIGTGNHPIVFILAGSLMASLIGKVKGKHYRSPWMHAVILNSGNYRFKPVKTDSDWLSRDRKAVDRYVKDPYCSFYFTCSAYQDFFHILMDLKRKKLLKQIPKDLPVYLLSGSMDPVGQFGRGVIQVYHQFQKLGLSDVTIKLYKDSRHEILNELNKKKVYSDILHWIQVHMEQA